MITATIYKDKRTDKLYVMNEMLHMGEKVCMVPMDKSEDKFVAPSTLRRWYTKWDEAQYIVEVKAFTGMKIGLPKETALASIRRYNELAALGEDLDFGKPAKRLFPIVDPPFYAAPFEPAPLLNCVSGLECDWRTRCYDAEGKIIPGLYATGNVQGGRFSGGYPTTVPGISHSMALTFGRQSGLCAAQEL